MPSFAAARPLGFARLLERIGSLQSPLPLCMQFIDDVEFWLRPENARVEYRSASRIGESDGEQMMTTGHPAIEVPLLGAHEEKLRSDPCALTAQTCLRFCCMSACSLSRAKT